MLHEVLVSKAGNTVLQNLYEGRMLGSSIEGVL